MIRMIASTDKGHAKSYFSDALSRSDYYMDDVELGGQIKGKLAVRLGIEGPATKEVFFDLCDNINPVSKKPLTPRTKEERITGYDINFHCPKSVSILESISRDSHIRDAFEKAVSDTMHDIERDVKTRIRKDGVYNDRVTGELIYGSFVHQTARPVEGKLVDPHLHLHAYVFNCTHDPVENRIKAGKWRDIKRDMPFYQAAFQKRLADNLVDIGYKIRKTKNAFEIDGVPQEIINHFSKRTNEIGEIAKEKGITDAKALDGLGAKTRGKKEKGMSLQALKAEWRKEIWKLMDELNLDKNKPIRHAPGKERLMTTSKECLDHAIAHCFERASVISERKILETAYKYSIGKTGPSVQEIADLLKQDQRIFSIKHGERQMCTTKDVLMEEHKMVELAKEGKGKLAPLYIVPPELSLEGEQYLAVYDVLTTKNRVCIIRGAAGTGKTTLMQEAVQHIEKVAKRVTVLAPTSETARDVLRKEGFKEAETVAKFLTDPKLQDKIQDQVLWIDEAGMLGTKDMLNLLSIATKKNARVVLAGDTRQHSAVVRGDALRILNTVGGIEVSEVSKIYRQRDTDYKDAVEHLSKGNVKDGFDLLDKMRAIKAIDPLNPHEELTNEYINTLKRKKTALIVSPTHKEGDAVTAVLRDKLRKEGLIGKKEIKSVRFQNLNLTEAQKNDRHVLAEGQVLQFNQNMPGIKRGSSWTIKEIKDDMIRIQDSQGETRILPSQSGKNFDVFNKQEIALAKGDKVRITRNGYDDEKKRLNNGMTLEVAAIDKKGKLILRNKASKARYKVDPDFGHIAHAYAVTSHASQGKTVDQVYIWQPADTFGDAKQFYVSVSRGRDAVKIYTDDREALLQNVSEVGDRQSALELLGRKDVHGEHIMHREIEKQLTQPKIEKAKNIQSPRKETIDLDYEPRI